ncbi:fdxN element excision controlling factor protein [Cylindrospermum sp. NIES-4074]|nr:fdxN element excision controlling factor protein [Cylindrospermum sp. NIES-4074]
MARVEDYRQYIQQILKNHASYQGLVKEIETQTIFDTESDHYQLVYVGWNDEHREYACMVHIDIKNNKIWIQHDSTEIGIANELIALGVPKEDIVLAFQSPYKRQFSGFAVG